MVNYCLYSYPDGRRCREEVDYRHGIGFCPEHKAIMERINPPSIRTWRRFPEEPEDTTWSEQLYTGLG